MDVGCGGGLLAEEFATMGFAVTGIDPSDKSLEVARAHAAQNALNIDYRLGYGGQFRSRKRRSTWSIASDVLEHIQNWDAVIGEIARVLKRNGVFLYDTVNRTTISKILAIKMLQECKLTHSFPPNLHVWEMFIKPEELKASLERHGLHNQDSRGTKLSGNPLRLLTPPIVTKSRGCGSEVLKMAEAPDAVADLVTDFWRSRPPQQELHPASTR